MNAEGLREQTQGYLVRVSTRPVNEIDSLTADIICS